MLSFLDFFECWKHPGGSIVTFLSFYIFDYLETRVRLAIPWRHEIISASLWRLKIGKEFFTSTPGTPLAEFTWSIFLHILRGNYVYINWAHVSIFGTVFLMELLVINQKRFLFFQLQELIIWILYPSMSKQLEMRTFWTFLGYSFWRDKFVIVWRVSTVIENLLGLA